MTAYSPKCLKVVFPEVHTIPIHSELVLRFA
jgi:hypothetical protein